MRYLLTSLLCVFTLSLTAQVDCPGPDFNNDGQIGSVDLITFLSYYGGAWPISEFFSCGDPISFDDYSYLTVQIGDQCWFAENCRYLPEVSPSSASSSTDAYYYVYDYQGTDVSAAKLTSNYEAYGLLYNWSALMSEGICPSGWHVPSDDEWQTMEISLGMIESEVENTGWRGTDEGYQMKFTSGWMDNGNGSNLSGFKALPGGYCESSGFSSNGEFGHWWTASESGSNSRRRMLASDFDSVFRGNLNKYYGFSARCLQD